MSWASGPWRRTWESPPAVPRPRPRRPAKPVNSRKGTADTSGVSLLGGPDLAELRRLIRLVQRTGIGELEVSSGGRTVRISASPGVVASLGYSGRGVPTGTMMGTVLAEWAMGARREDLAVPLEPLRSVPLYMNFAPRLFLAWSRIRDQRLARAGGANPPPF